MPEYTSVKIPADVERPDKVLAGFTARQVAVLVATAVLLYAGWVGTRALVPFGVFLVVAIPVVAAGVVLALARREGIGFDEYARAALMFRLGPRQHHNPDTHPHGSGGGCAGGCGDVGVPSWVAARAHHTHRRPRCVPMTPASVPARGITTPAHGPSEIGLLELGGHGLALVAACSTVNFALRTQAEQHGLIDCFARMLHAQTGALQILVRSHPVDLTPALAQLAHASTTLAHPALRTAAAGHHQWLTELAHTEGLLTRQVLIVLREPTTRARATTSPALATTAGGTTAGGIAAGGIAAARAVVGAQARLVRRLAELRRALAPADITVTALSPAQLEVVLATSADPTRHLPSVPRPSPGTAWADIAWADMARSDMAWAERAGTR